MTFLLSLKGYLMGDLESFGNSSTENNEIALQMVADFLAKIKPGHMTQKFVLLIETIDEDDRNLLGYTAPGQKVWDTLGMLEFVSAFEKSGGESQE